MATDKQIIDEIVGKKKDYETRLGWRLTAWLKCAEQVLGRDFTGKENFIPTVATAELYKAIRAETNMIYRMLTSQRPFFQLEPLDIIGATDPTKLVLQEHYLTQQMDLVGFNRSLYDFIGWFLTYGTQVAHMTYEPVRAPFLGRRQYATYFRPVSLINTAFALDTSKLEDCGWVSLSGAQSQAYLESLLKHDDEKQPIYKAAALKAAINSEIQGADINVWTQQRLALAGYMTGQFDKTAREMTTYYGPLEVIGDGKMYVCQYVNNEFLIRKEVYAGIRPIAIATMNNFDIEPLGNGIYDTHRHHLEQLNSIQNDLLNSLRLVGANMFTKQKALGDEDADFAVRNMGILELEAPQSMQPLVQNPAAIAQLTAAKEMFKQDFRQASGATDVLQAIIPNENVTATASSLAMNESVRNLSVMAETLLANQTIGQYCKVALENWHKYQTEGETILVKGQPISVNPADLRINSKVIVKTMTDQDFRPAKLQRLMTVLQTMASMPPDAINGYKINVGPTLMEVMRLLDVPNFAQSISPITEEDLMRAAVTNQMLNPQLAAAEQPPVEGTMSPGNRMANETPGRKERRSMNKPTAGMETMPTPVGEVMTAPGDSLNTPAAIRSSNNA